MNDATARRIYLAGPEVFRPDVREHFETMKRFMEQHGLLGLSPFDNEASAQVADRTPADVAKKIYQANCSLLRSCDAVMANMTPFRGPSMDVGTAYEIGYADALGLPVFAYSTDQTTYASRVPQPARNYIDADGWAVENFGLTDNLMMIGAASLAPDRPVYPSWRDAVLAIEKWVCANG